jgi:3-hydroxyacyl-CoA dehydrogenase
MASSATASWPYKQAADYIMEDGASPYEIDEAVRGFGYPMGPSR